MIQGSAGTRSSLARGPCSLSLPTPTDDHPLLRQSLARLRGRRARARKAPPEGQRFARRHGPSRSSTTRRMSSLDCCLYCKPVPETGSSFPESLSVSRASAAVGSSATGLRRVRRPPTRLGSNCHGASEAGEERCAGGDRGRENQGRRAGPGQQAGEDENGDDPRH